MMSRLFSNTENATSASRLNERIMGLAPHRLTRVLSSIESRLAESIRVQELAEVVHMSPFHFTRMFKLATGQSPHRYITRLRVEEAKRLLATTDMPINRVASAVGYQTQAHFTGVFARHVGNTPKRYRLQQRAGASSSSSSS